MTDRDNLNMARIALDALRNAGRALDDYPPTCCELGWCAGASIEAEDAYCEGGAVDGINEALSVIIARARKRVEDIERRMLRGAGGRP